MDALSRIRKTVNDYQDKITLDDADGNLAFEVIDLVKPDKLVPTFVKGAEYSDWRKELDV